AKSYPRWIIVRTSAPDAALPPPGTRITPDYATVLPKIVSPNSEPALSAAAGAHHYRLIGLELTVADGVSFSYGVVHLGWSETSLDQLPHHLVLDRVYVHGTPNGGLFLGVALNSAWTAIIDSYLSEVHASGTY